MAITAKIPILLKPFISPNFKCPCQARVIKEFERINKPIVINCFMVLSKLKRITFAFAYTLIVTEILFPDNNLQQQGRQSEIKYDGAYIGDRQRQRTCGNLGIQTQGMQEGRNGKSEKTSANDG